MKWIVTILIILCSNLFSYDLKKVDFATFCNYVSYQTNLNIIISDGVDTSFSVFMPTDSMTISDLKKSFFKILKVKKLNYDIYDNTVLIYKYKKPIVQPAKHSFIIRFNFVPSSVITNYLKNFYPNIKFQIFQDRLLVYTDYSTYKSILNSIIQIDNSYKSAQVNFLITVINNKKAKTLNFKNTINLPSLSRFYLNLITSTTTISTSAVQNFSFTSFINYLNSKGVAETISKPTLNLIDSKNYVLESVQNIPYITKSVTTNKDGEPVTQTNLKYKDIGLKIYIKNVFISDKTIDFDLDLYVQNIVSYIQNNQPVTDVKHFNTHIQLTKNRSHYLIAGLRSVTKIDNSSNVPLFSKIPFISIFFKTKDKQIQDLSFTIYISTNYFNKVANHSSAPRSDVGAPQEMKR